VKAITKIEEEGEEEEEEKAAVNAKLDRLK